MADERSGQHTGKAADNDHLQTAGRKANAAQPLNAAKDRGGAERYPPARADDAVERADPVEEPRTFNQAHGTSDATTRDVATNEGRFGRGADPAEGKR